jgi:hypothetical protein
MDRYQITLEYCDWEDCSQFTFTVYGNTINEAIYAAKVSLYVQVAREIMSLHSFLDLPDVVNTEIIL